MKKLLTLLLISFLSVSIVNAADPDVVMTTAMMSGETFSMSIAAQYNPIQVDWGDGVLKTLTSISTNYATPTKVSKVLTVDNPTIKFYIPHLMTLRYTANMKLTSLDLITTAKLRRLDAVGNQLTAITGLSQCPVLGTIFLNDNLFDACGIEDVYNSLYDYTGKVTGNLIIGDSRLSNNTQNQAIIDSKISIATAKNWNICDAGVGGSANPGYYILETTGIGCVLTPDVIMQSTMMTGESFSMKIQASKSPIKVDFGDGIMRSYTVGTTFDGSPTTVTFDLPVDNPTIKIYGDLLNLRVQSLQLTSLELINTPKLRRLDAFSNQLTTLTDLSQCPVLGLIYLNDNLFDACQIETLYGALYDYTGATNPGSLMLYDSRLTDNTQNQDIIDSKISIANAKNWNVCDAALLKADPGYYILETTGIGCVQSSVEKTLTPGNFEICPSLVKENLSIKFNQPMLGNTIAIYNIVGKLMKTHIIESDHVQLNVENYPKGLYFIRVGDSTKKVIKK